MAVLGIVHPGADPASAAAAAVDAQLEGVVLEGEFPDGAGFAGKVEAGLRANESTALVIPIAKDVASVRNSKAPVLAVEGVRPRSRHPMEDGIRASVSTEPWIWSNIWVVRSLRSGKSPRPVWISQESGAILPGDQSRCVADAAAAGGRWIVTLDDEARARLARKDADALRAWRSASASLKFAEEHAEWRAFEPFGNIAIILDTASQYPEISNEYLNLVARRQIPYRVIPRSQLNSAALGGLRAVLAVDLAPPTEAERKILRAFAEAGGTVMTGAAWGNPPQGVTFAEVPLGKGRVIVYMDDPPDPEAVARDMLDVLDPEVIGLAAYNVPSTLAYATTVDNGKRVLVQLLNYASHVNAGRVTVRLNGSFKTARFYTPEAAPADLAVEAVANGRTQFAISDLSGWSAILLQ
jgi:hypothetical protein